MSGKVASVRDISVQIRASRIPQAENIALAFERLEGVVNSNAIRMSTGTTVAATSSSGTTGGTDTPPDDVILGTPVPTLSGPDAFGHFLYKVTLPYTVPGAWTGTGVHGYDEVPDMSAGTSWTLGTTPLGTGNLQGQWLPHDDGQQPYNAAVAQNYFVFYIAAPDKSTSIRLRLVAYSDTIDPAVTQSTPSVTLTLAPPALDNSGTRATANVTLNSFTQGSPKDEGNGIMVTPFTISFSEPSDKNYVSCDVMFVPDDPTITPFIVNYPKGHHDPVTIPFKTGITLEGGNCWLVARGVNGSNGIVPGVTPSFRWSVGNLQGTLNAAAILLTSIAPHLQVVSGVFGVKPEGITGDLVAAAAIDTIHLVDAAVGNSKIANFAVDAAKVQNAVIGNSHLDRATANKIAIVDADIVNLTAAKITAGTLAVGVVYAGNIAASQITVGTLTGFTINAATVNSATVNSSTITGSTVTINSNGYTTTLNNYDPGTGSGFIGFSVENNSTSAAAYVAPTFFGFNYPGLGFVKPVQIDVATSKILVTAHEIFVGQALLSSATSGSATLPATPAGFITITYGFGSTGHIPVYN